MMNCDTDGREMNCDTDGHIVSSPHPRKMENLQVGSEKPGTPRWRQFVGNSFQLMNRRNPICKLCLKPQLE